MEEKKVSELPYEQRKQAVLEAISRGEYSIEIEEPNNIIHKTHPDGSDFYVLRGDDIKFGVCAGSCSVTIEGIEFTCDLDWGEWSGNGGDLLDDEEVMEAIEGIDGVICGEHHSDDEYISIFEAANNCKVEEYYGCWEKDVPPDVDEIMALEDMWQVTGIDHEGKRYYIIDDQMHEADDEHHGQRWAYAAHGEPDNWGKYGCVVLLLEGDRKDEVETEIVTGVEECDLMMNQFGDVE